MTVNSPLLAVLRREIRRIASRRSSLALLILVPFSLFVLVALLYGEGVVKNIPVAIIDLDRTAYSRMLTATCGRS